MLMFDLVCGQVTRSIDFLGSRLVIDTQTRFVIKTANLYLLRYIFGS